MSSCPTCLQGKLEHRQEAFTSIKHPPSAPTAALAPLGPVSIGQSQEQGKASAHITSGFWDLLQTLFWTFFWLLCCGHNPLQLPLGKEADTIQEMLSRL